MRTWSLNKKFFNFTHYGCVAFGKQGEEFLPKEEVIFYYFDLINNG